MIATTGFFDGVHSGHRLVIERLVSEAHARGDESLVVTFWPHPRAVLQDGARELRLLTTLEEKKAILRRMGVDRVEVLGFSRAFASMTAEQYLRTVLQDRFGVTTLLMGYDNRIGCDRKTAADLKPLVRNMDIIELPALSTPTHTSSSPAPTGDPAVSSTRIRKALETGDIRSATQMLGYGYSLEGAVVAGNRMGRTIGFPTANMQLYEPLKLIPAHGVYAVQAEVLGRSYRGMTNIGTRPTVGGTVPTIETHLLDFDEDIYGLPLRITVLRRIRDEVRFPSLDALKAQLTKDREACRTCIFP